MSARRLFPILMLAAVACVPTPLPDDDVLQVAEAAYERGDFAAAIDQLEFARATGAGDPAVIETAWGLAALQSEQALTALIHLRRAAFLRGGVGEDDRLADWIDRCELALDLRPGTSEAPAGRTTTAWGLLAIAILVQILALLGLSHRRWLIVIFLVGAAIGIYAAAEIFTPDPPALLAQPGQRLCSDPHLATAFGPVLRPGIGLRIQASSDRWCEVRAGEQTGWLPAESLARLAEPPSALR